jgi:hypothetical protein
MVKKKSNTSLFSALAQKIHSESPTTSECHLIDNEYFVGFNSVDDIQEFHQKLIEKQPKTTEQEEDEEDQEMDMKTFAQQYLIDLPEPTTTTREEAPSTPIATGSKRQRRNIRDLPQSSNFIFMSDDDRGNIFDSLKSKKSSSQSKRIAYEDMSSILLTLDVKQKRKKHGTRNDNSEPIVAIELAEPSLIKAEPVEEEEEEEQVCFINRNEKSKRSIEYFSL